MKILPISLTVISSITLTATLMLASSSVSAANEWRLEKSDANIQVYLRDTPGFAVKSFKGTLKTKRTLATLVKVISDTSSYSRWLHDCKSAKLLKQPSKFEMVNYVVTAMPWPVANRDLIVASKLTQNPSTKRIEISLDAKPKFSGYVEGLVRIEKMKGRWTLTPLKNGFVDVTYEMSLDPGGNIPKWLVNTMTVDLPFNTLKNLENISKEPQYANAKVEGIVELK